MAGRKHPAAARRPTVRAGAHSIDLYDEGGALFFYDEANTRAIAAGLPTHPGSANDPSHVRLAKSGRLVTARLAGDGAARLELALGDPLSSAEHARLPWLDAQEALLDLPSGRLHVETPSTIPIPRPDPDAPPGFVTDVAPGRYRLSLYRLDERAVETSGKPYRGPRLFVALSPVGPRENVPTPAVIPWIERQEAAPTRRHVEGGAFHGLARFGGYWDSFRVNVDAAAAKVLGLVQGAGLHVDVPDVELSADAVYSDLVGDLVNVTPAEKRGLPREFAVAFPEEIDGEAGLSFWRIKTAAAIEKRLWHKWWPAKLRVGPAPKLAPKLAERLSPRGGRPPRTSLPDLVDALRTVKKAREARHTTRRSRR